MSPKSCVDVHKPPGGVPRDCPGALPKPLREPLVDFFLIASLPFGAWRAVLPFFLIFVALDVFLASGHATACVQARLTIDNTGDGWLASGIMAQTPQALGTARGHL